MYAEPTELTAQVSALLAGEAAPSSAALLQLALLCLQTGHPDQATRLRCSGQLSAEHLAELQSLESCDPLSLYTSWKAAASNGWQAALTPDALLEEGAQLAIFDPKVSAEQIAADLGVEALVGSEGEGVWQPVVDPFAAVCGAVAHRVAAVQAARLAGNP